jgi:hypothetical protein
VVLPVMLNMQFNYRRTYARLLRFVTRVHCGVWLEHVVRFHAAPAPTATTPWTWHYVGHDQRQLLFERRSDDHSRLDSAVDEQRSGVAHRRGG